MAEVSEAVQSEERVTAEVAQQLPTTKLSNRPQAIEEVHLDELLRLVVEKRGSDLHLASGVPPVIRVDGQLLATPYEPMTEFEVQRMIYAILTDEQIRAFETELELDCSYQLKSVSRFRVNVYRDRGSCAGAFRVIPSRIPTIRELGLPLVLEELSRKPRGLILVTGPTGSGKSTTLAAVLGQINNERSTHIITIEDPIEYLHTHRRSLINQRELGMDTRSFAQALKHSLRQDPDVILVGEIRDAETALIATEAALTGHLVFSTLHTNDAPSAVARMMEMGIEPFLISSAVIGVLAQRLVRVICPECKESYTPPVEAFRRLNLAMDLESVTFYRGRGCERCRHNGYRGRIGVFELMMVTDPIRELVLKKAPAHRIREEALQSGMITLKQDAMQKVLEGITTMEEALRVVYTG